MMIQPDVEDETGERRKLDDVLGSWFAVIGWQIDPQSVMSADDRAFWHQFGARFVHVCRSRCGAEPGRRAATSRDTVCVEDVDNHFADWIAAHPGPMLVLRPDRYIAAQSDAARFAEVTRSFRSFVPERPVQQRLAA